MDEADGRRHAAPWIWVAALWALAVVVYAFLGQRNSIPSISPDEFSYGHLARSIADGDGLTWRGASEPMRAALYVYAIAPAWLGDSTTTAFATSKLLSALMCCTVAVPAWLMVRRLVSPWLALATAALALAGTWMLVTASIITENLAYPLGVTALAGILTAVRRPASRWPWIAIGLIALAAFSRAQLAVLVAVLPLAALLDAARGGRAGLAEGLRRHRVTLIAGGALSAVALVVVLAKPDVLGTYAGVTTLSPSIGSLLTVAGRHATGLVALAGLALAVLVVTLTVLRAAWADAETGPLLATFWAAAIVVVVQVSFYLAGSGSGYNWHIDRYMMYLVPLAAAVMVVGVTRIRLAWQPVVIVTLVLSVLMLLAAPIRNVTEEEGTFGIVRPVHAVLGTGTAGSLAVATLVVGLLAGALAARVGSRRGGPALAWSLVALVAGVFAIQDVATWTWRLSVLHDVRADQPRDLRWVDHARGGPVARVVIDRNFLGAQITEFFNRGIAQAFVPDAELGFVDGPAVRGRTCPWNVLADGTLTIGAGCGELPHRFLLQDEYAKLTFDGQRIAAREPKNGQVVETGPGRPRALALVFLPCGRPQHQVVLSDDGIPRKEGVLTICGPELRGNLWPGRAGRLELRFRGGTGDHQVAAGGKVFAVPAGRTTTIRVAVPAQPTAFQFQLDWSGTAPEFPELQGLDLVRGRSRTSLLGDAA